EMIKVSKKEGKSVHIENNGDKAIVFVNNGNDVTIVSTEQSMTVNNKRGIK
ncbi:TPA: hypothetical protein U5Z65_002128, partial [Streptococcus agalactiae]|nr:hypothetical protein [Streptococcus agalactiae]HEO7155077.1 hypothetical protein [Streptococcus agalactiae]